MDCGIYWTQKRWLSTMNSQQLHSNLLIIQHTKPSRTNSANRSHSTTRHAKLKKEYQNKGTGTPTYVDNKTSRFLNKIKDQRRRIGKPVHQCYYTADWRIECATTRSTSRIRINFHIRIANSYPIKMPSNVI